LTAAPPSRDGVVLSALSATAARASVVLALWSGAAALVAGAWLSADEFASERRP
jgi:hypothetical protein